MLRGESDREKIREIQALAREIIRLNGGRDIRFVPMPEHTEVIYCDTDGVTYIDNNGTVRSTTWECLNRSTTSEEGLTDGKENRTSNTGRH